MIMTLLLFILVIALFVFQRRTERRLHGLEKELEALKADVLIKRTVATEAVEEKAAATEKPAVAAALPVPDPGYEPAISEPAIEPTPGEPTPSRPKSRESLESYLGARWPVWVGGVALAFGGVFLARYSIEAGLLGPKARLTLAAIFGIVLVAAGEFVRRRTIPKLSEPKLSERFGNAMIPGILTAAGAVTLFGAIFAAHAIYFFIGPTLAFLLLALVSFATIALSLLHGQAVAGLGLLASLLTPILVASEKPNAPALFGFLAVSWIAAIAASRLRRWIIVPMLANLGLGIWVLVYSVTTGPDFDPVPPALALIVMIAGTAFVWPGPDYGMIGPSRPGFRSLLSRSPLPLMLSVSIVALLPTLSVTPQSTGMEMLAAAAVIATLAGLGAGRTYAIWPTLFAALGTLPLAFFRIDSEMIIGFFILNEITSITVPVSNHIEVFLLLGAVFTLLGLAFLKRYRTQEPECSTIWAFLMPAVPIMLATVSFIDFADLWRDWTHGLYGLALGLILLGAANWLFRQSENSRDGRIDWPANLLVAGSFAGFLLALHALTNGIVTTISVSIVGFAYVLGMRIRSWPALPWMMAAAILIVFGRIAWEPTLIGPNSLGTTPFLNALLPGYGIPTLLAIATAWMLKASPDIRIRNIMQALASLAALVTVAILVRHAMNNGVLDDRAVTLGEQSIYTLITVGFSGVLMMLDLQSPSPVFRIGSMIAGVIATINVLSLHVFVLNPYFSGENTGGWPFVNLLLLGYLLPAGVYALAARQARGRRPRPYVVMLALAGSLLGFLWATLSVRRFWQGENIADWKGFMQSETYTYSVVWLLIGVALLVAGSRIDARSLRLTSAVLVLLAVLKVFLIDMSNLEGLLRALSFIGLGAVLIGIGLFYQRILLRKNHGNAIGPTSPSAEIP